MPDLKTHYRAEDGHADSDALCGLVVTHRGGPVTEDPEEVTCKRCRSQLRSILRARRSVLLTDLGRRIAERADDAGFLFVAGASHCCPACGYEPQQHVGTPVVEGHDPDCPLGELTKLERGGET